MKFSEALQSGIKILHRSLGKNGLRPLAGLQKNFLGIEKSHKTNLGAVFLLYYALRQIHTYITGFREREF